MPPPIGDVETIRLKRDLQRAKETIESLQAELNATENRLAESEINLEDCRAELRRARQDLAKMDEISRIREQEAIEQERMTMRDSLSRAEVLRKESEDFRVKQAYYEKQIEEKDQEIEMYKADLQRIGGVSALHQTQEDFKRHKVESLNYRKTLEDYTDQCNQLQENVQDLLAENNLLRQMAGVGSNFGIKIEDIKLLENQTVQQYRARIVHLEEDLEAMEKERVDLKHQLRLLSVYKGEFGKRHEGLSDEQVRHLDEYALNLISGRIEIPLTDKSRELERENLRLKERIDMMEVYISEQLENLSKKLENSQVIGMQNTQMSIGARRRNRTRMNISNVNLTENFDSSSKLNHNLQNPFRNDSLGELAEQAELPGSRRAKNLKDRTKSRTHVSIREGGMTRESQYALKEQGMSQKGSREGLKRAGMGSNYTSNESLLRRNENDEHHIRQQGMGMSGQGSKVGWEDFNAFDRHRYPGPDDIESVEEEDEEFEDLRGGREIMKELTLIKDQLHKLSAARIGDQLGASSSIASKLHGSVPRLQPQIQRANGLGDFQGIGGYQKVVSAEVQKLNETIRELQEHVNLLNRVNIETLETLNRREEEFTVLSVEVGDTREKLKNSMFLQDELCKKYIFEKKMWEKQRKDFEKMLYEESIATTEANHRKEILENSIKTINSGQANKMAERIADLTQRLSMSEGNLMKLSRMISNYKDTIQMLEKSLAGRDIEKLEREKFLRDRIVRMKADRAELSKKMSLLVKWVIESVDKASHEALRNECQSLREVLEHKQGKENDLLTKISSLKQEVGESRRLLQRSDEFDEAASEIADENRILKLRLLKIDKLFHELIPFLQKASKIPREKVTSLIKSILSREESEKRITVRDFQGVLYQLGVNENPQWWTALTEFYDSEGFGSLHADTFIRLFPSGTRQKIGSFFEYLASSGQSIEEVFGMMDKDEDGFITYEDTVVLAEANRDLPDHVRAILGPDLKRVSLPEFISLAAPREVLNSEKALIAEKANVWKYSFIIDFEQSAKEANLSLNDVFNLIDINQDGELNSIEFRQMFERMKVKISPQQLNALFNTLDVNHDGNITYVEFLLFLKKAKEHMTQIKRMELSNKLQERVGADLALVDVPKLQENQKHILSEQRERMWRKKVETIEAQRRMAQKDAAQYSKQITDLTEKLYRTEQNLFESNSRYREAEFTREQSLKLALTESLKAERDELEAHLSSSQAANETFKGLAKSTNELLNEMRLRFENWSEKEMTSLQSMVSRLSSLSDEKRMVFLALKQVDLLLMDLQVLKKEAGAMLQENLSLREDNLNLEAQRVSFESEAYENVQALTETIRNIREELAKMEGASGFLKTSFDREKYSEKLSELLKENEQVSRDLKEQQSKNGDLRVKLEFSEYDNREKNRLYALITKNSESDLILELSSEHQKNNQLKLMELRITREMEQLKDLKSYFEKVAIQEKELASRMEVEIIKCREDAINSEAILRKRIQELAKRASGEGGVNGSLSFSANVTVNQSGNNQGAVSGNNFGRNMNGFSETGQRGGNFVSGFGGSLVLEDRIKELQEENKRLREQIALGRDEGNPLAIEERMRVGESERMKQMAMASQKAQGVLKSLLDDKDSLLEQKEASIEEMRIKWQNEARKAQDLASRYEKELKEVNDKYHELLKFDSKRERADISKIASAKSILEEKDFEEQMKVKELTIKQLTSALQGKTEEVEELKSSLNMTKVAVERAEDVIRGYKEKEQSQNDFPMRNSRVDQLRREREKLVDAKELLSIERERLEAAKKAFCEMKSSTIKEQEDRAEMETKLENERAKVREAESFKERNKQLEREIKTLKTQVSDKNAVVTQIREENEINVKELSHLRRENAKLENENKKMKNDLAKKPANPPSAEPLENENQMELEHLRKENAELLLKLSNMPKEEPQVKSATSKRPASGALSVPKGMVAIGTVTKEGDFYKIDDFGYLVPKSNTTFAHFGDLVSATRQVLGELFYNHYTGFQNNQPSGTATSRCLAFLRGFGVKLREPDQKLLEEGLSADKLNVGNPEECTKSFIKKVLDPRQLPSGLIGPNDKGGKEKEKFSSSAISHKTSSSGARLREIGQDKRSIEALAKQLKEISKERDKFRDETIRLNGEIDIMRSEATEQRAFARQSASNWKASGMAESLKYGSQLGGHVDVPVKVMQERIFELEGLLEKTAARFSQEKEESAHNARRIVTLEVQLKELLNLKDMFLAGLSKGPASSLDQHELIYRLMTQLDRTRNGEMVLSEKIGKLEKENAQLKYYTETYDQKIERLQRRIQELTAP